MYRTFSQRMGFKNVKSVIQVDSMDDDLRISLWNVFLTNIWKYWYGFEMNFEEFYFGLWINYFKKPLDTIPNRNSAPPSTIREYFFRCDWYEVYDFLQFIAETFPFEPVTLAFIVACNSVLERELSGYRFVGDKLMPIVSNEEVAEIEEALQVSKKFSQHLDQALTLLADRKSPDYANSIKESISAVEAAGQLITGNHKATLGDILRQLENKLGGGMHPALRNAFNSLYGYASDADGIRHALLGKSDLDVEDARFMLIACSAFINYLVVKADKAGIQL